MDEEAFVNELLEGPLQQLELHKLLDFGTCLIKATLTTLMTSIVYKNNEWKFVS